MEDTTFADAPYEERAALSADEARLSRLAEALRILHEAKVITDGRYGLRWFEWVESKGLYAVYEVNEKIPRNIPVTETRDEREVIAALVARF